MSFFKEFKSFAMKGNIVDLAVAVIIGGAFGNIVSSLVDDMITPLLLSPALKAANVHEIAGLTWGEIKYGNFLSSVIKFIMIALVLFSLIKMMNAFKKKEEAAAPAAPSTTDQLLTEIRDALKK
jgi:large conductance mechanosensitive channel